MTDSIFPAGAEPILPILPLRNSVLFPATVVPVNVGRARSVRLIEEACGGERAAIGVVTQHKPEVEDPTFDQVYHTGTIARVLKVDPQRVWEEWSRDRRALTADGSAPTPPNEFSGRTYRAVNLVADIPLRLDDIMPDVTPAIAFAQTEIQLVDEETALANNAGENSHARYKKRQRSRVKLRLEGTGGTGDTKVD